MKKLVSMMLSFVLVMSLFAGCGSTKETTESQADTQPAETVAESVAETAAPEVTAKNQSGTVVTKVDMSQYEAGKEVRVWLPVPQNGDDQVIEDVKFNAGDAKAELTTDETGNQMLYVEWDKDADPATRKATLSFHASRNEVLRPELKEEGEIGADMDEYLKETSTIIFSDEIVATAEEITQGQDTVLGKARAVYDWVIANMNRDNDVIGCGKGEVCELLNTKAGKCTDINSMFVALCRAAGVPAREMFGVRMNAEVITGNQHCWAQFYLPGTGWVYADPADVLKAVLTNSWDKEQAEAKELQEYYWGNVDEKRVELSAGRDIVLSPAQNGEALNNFGYPYAEVDGEAVDYYAPADFAYSMEFIVDPTQRTVYVTPDWVKSVLDDQQAGYEDAIIMHVAYGPVDGTDYADGHLQGAQYLDICEVEDATGDETGAYNLLPAEQVEQYLLAQGVTKDTKVIMYGADPSGVARAAYGYIWAGVEDVKILNGGLAAWTAAGYETETEAHEAVAVDAFGTTVPAHPEYWVSIEDAKNRVESDPNFKLVSIRSEAEWLGETSGYSYMDKAGEPKGAVWGKGAQTAFDVADFTNEDGTVKNLTGLQQVWADCDFTLENDLAFYCGTGWRAAVPFCVLYGAGYDNIAMYDGGWYEWLMHGDYPVQVGDPAGDVTYTTVDELETGKAAN